MKRHHRYLIALLALLLLGCSPLLRGKGSRRAHLDKAADKILSASSLRGASWSIMAVDLQDGRVLMTREVDRSLVPASNIKLLGTSCALETLGPEYRIATTIGHTGRAEPDGVLPATGRLPQKSHHVFPFWTTDTFSAW
jgi:D-alanyl-D-alanine carboxypeptidase/D-alanyl-D-alanine-endopeptidase (penicillin-binding protein 4)